MLRMARIGIREIGVASPYFPHISQGTLPNGMKISHNSFPCKGFSHLVVLPRFFRTFPFRQPPDRMASATAPHPKGGRQPARAPAEAMPYPDGKA